MVNSIDFVDVRNFTDFFGTPCIRLEVGSGDLRFEKHGLVDITGSHLWISSQNVQNTIEHDIENLRFFLLEFSET